jgi:quercetin dioxygenase-like cupin family protein
MFVNKEQLFVSFDDIAWEDKGGGIRRKVMAYGDQLMGVYVEFMRGSVGALHSHPHVQFTYIKAGTFRVTIGRDERVMKAGDFYYIPSGLIHGAEALDNGVLVDVFTPMREDFVPKS